MRIEATIKSVIQDGGDLSLTLRGWYDVDPVGTTERPLGTINVPASDRNCRAYHIGRKLIIDVRPK